MPSTAITAQGITIARFGTTTFETIPNVVSFQGPGGQASVIDVTNLASTAKEKRVGLRDEGQLSLSLHFNPDDTVHQGLRTDRANRVRRQSRSPSPTPHPLRHGLSTATLHSSVFKVVWML